MNREMGAVMAAVEAHLSVEALEERYRACGDATSARHHQVIWVLANGHSIAEVSAIASFVRPFPEVRVSAPWVWCR